MKINLIKGRKISLEKRFGTGLTKVDIRLGWNAVKKKGVFGFGFRNTIDLDASCAMFDENKRVLDIIWFKQLKSKDGSIVHTGDIRKRNGDDEQIQLDLARVPASVKSLVFTLKSFRGQCFNEVENAYCRLVDSLGNSELVKYTSSGGGSHNAQIMAKIYRYNGEWKMHAIGEPANGQTLQDLIPAAVASL